MKVQINKLNGNFKKYELLIDDKIFCTYCKLFDAVLKRNNIKVNYEYTAKKLFNAIKKEIEYGENIVFCLEILTRLKTLSTTEIEHCKRVHKKLKSREINPKGKFDSAGRWYSENFGLVSCRDPSRAYPYSEMLHCRTLKYVKKCALVYGVTNLESRV